MVIDKIHSVEIKNKAFLTDPFLLKKLVGEMHCALSTGPVIDYNSLRRFNHIQKHKFNPFGYDLRKGEDFSFSQPFYRKNYLLHKLIRINKEFKFVKNHLKNYQQLTCREKEIIQLLSEGRNNPKIAEQLYISRHTVEEHRKHINCKLNVHSLPFLMQYAYSFNLI
jgi:DNA-binding CsgD family transcriptional regulator